MPKIFTSYRRQDSEHSAECLYERLRIGRGTGTLFYRKRCLFRYPVTLVLSSILE